MFLKSILFVSILLSFVINGVPTHSLAQDEGPTYREVIHIDPETRSDLNHIGWAEWSPDGTQLAFIDFPDVPYDENQRPIVDLPQIHILNTESWEIELTIPEARAGQFTWNPNGGQLAAVAGGNNDRPYGTLSIWNTESGELSKQLFLDFDLLSFDIPSDYLYVVPMSRISWSPDGTWIASDGDTENVILWNLETDDISMIGRHTNGRIAETAWKPDSTLMASTAGDGAIRIWDIHSGTNVLTIEDVSILVDWHPYENKMAGVDFEATVHIWDTDTGETLVSLDHDATVLFAKWNYDGSLIATGDLEGEIYIWDAQTGRQLMTFNEIKNSIISLDWNPTQNLLVGTGYDGELWVWEIIT